MKIRVAFVNGIWQLCMAAASLRQEREKGANGHFQDFLVVYNRPSGSFSNQALTQFVTEVASQVWDWQAIAQLPWQPRKWSPDLMRNKLLSVQVLLNLFNLSSPARVDEVWLCKLQFLDERLFADIFNQAEIVMYEDGLHTYAPTNYLINLPEVHISQPYETLAAYKKFLRNWVQGNFNWSNNGVKRSHLRRIKNFYSVLGTSLSIAQPFSQVSTELLDNSLLQQFFKELGNTLDLKVGDRWGNAKLALFLGSNLSHMQSFPRDLEVEAFVEAIVSAQQQGYTILWKEHPRCQEPLFDKIKDKLTLSNKLYLLNEQSVPTEVFVSQLPIELCYSTLSSSLFYLKSIYGIETVTCVRPLLKFLQGDFRYLADLTLQHIPPSI